MGKWSYTETVANVAKGEGAPCAASVRTHCDLGLIPHVRDANGRRLLRSDARELAKRLERHFERELTTGACLARFEVIEGLHKAARKGNVSAASAYLRKLPQRSRDGRTRTSG